MLDKYNPAEIESKHYQNWENQGYFQPDMALPVYFFQIRLLYMYLQLLPMHYSMFRIQPYLQYPLP